MVFKGKEDLVQINLDEVQEANQPVINENSKVTFENTSNKKAENPKISFDTKDNSNKVGQRFYSPKNERGCDTINEQKATFPNMKLDNPYLSYPSFIKQHQEDFLNYIQSFYHEQANIIKRYFDISTEPIRQRDFIEAMTSSLNHIPPNFNEQEISFNLHHLNKKYCKLSDQSTAFNRQTPYTGLQTYRCLQLEEENQKLFDNFISTSALNKNSNFSSRSFLSDLSISPLRPYESPNQKITQNKQNSESKRIEKPNLINNNQHFDDSFNKTQTASQGFKNHLIQTTSTTKNNIHNINGALINQNKDHFKSHDPENMYIQCPICQKRIKRLYHFHRHMRIHTGEKSHQCPYCHYKSVRKDNLKSHMKTHEKHFKVDRCLKRQHGTETKNQSLKPDEIKTSLFPIYNQNSFNKISSCSKFNSQKYSNELKVKRKEQNNISEFFQNIPSNSVAHRFKLQNPTLQNPISLENSLFHLQTRLPNVNASMFPFAQPSYFHSHFYVDK